MLQGLFCSCAHSIGRSDPLLWCAFVRARVPGGWLDRRRYEPPRGVLGRGPDFLDPVPDREDPGRSPSQYKGSTALSR